MEYSVSFTAGALLCKESVRVVEELRKGVPPEEVNPDILEINSVRGRRQKASEIIKRLSSAERSVWEDLSHLSAA